MRVANMFNRLCLKIIAQSFLFYFIIYIIIIIFALPRAIWSIEIRLILILVYFWREKFCIANAMYTLALSGAYLYCIKLCLLRELLKNLILYVRRSLPIVNVVIMSFSFLTKEADWIVVWLGFTHWLATKDVVLHSLGR